MEFEGQSVAAEVVDEASAAFIGRWQRLVSMTNWEKGRIIFEWRSALMASAAPNTDYSDEAWSRMVGGVTGQHAGRLRRVYERFGAIHTDYEGLYWSHFQNALDWDDAEMWLEGAVQNGWSVSRMRQQRWDTLGVPATQQTLEPTLTVIDVDEDFETRDTATSDSDNESRDYSGDHADEPRRIEGPDFGDEDDRVLTRDRSSLRTDEDSDATIDPEDVVTVRPFADLPQLPADMAEAFEALQLSILRHKANEWAAISLENVLVSLDALKELARAES